MKALHKAPLALVFAAAILAVGCTSEPIDISFGPNQETLDDGTDVEEEQGPATGTGEIEPTGIISEVMADTVSGTFFAGAPPATTNDITLAPLTVDGETIQFISGGSTQVSLESDTPFITVYVLVDSEGYFQIDLPGAVTSTNLIITFSTIQLDGQVDIVSVQVGNAAGSVSGVQELPVSSVVVGTGDLQVSVSWNTIADVDLYLQEPSGETISFTNTTSDAGGALDLDSNIGCPEGAPQNENITYENVVPPSGEYTVLLDLFSTCGRVTTATDYVVTVRIADDVQTYTGSLLDTTTGSDVVITTFEVR